MLHSAGIPIRPAQSLRITFAGLFASNFLPTTIGGDVVRLGGAIRLGYDRAISLASLIVDRLVGMAGMAMALPFITPLLIPTVKGTAATSLFAMVALPGKEWLSKITHKVAQGIKATLEALSQWKRQPGTLLASTAFTWLHMLCLFSQIWLLLDGMQETIPFWQVAGLWSATYFITLLPISINGMGVQELATTFFYGVLGGISNPASLTLALLLRVLQMLASLPGALFIPEMLAGEERK
ncbi:MAG: flippase-like domain-containing protein [Anaerolineales bacterium]|nr:flippase-like domain-containing protein [Anaerolineales bacterium]